MSTDTRQKAIAIVPKFSAFFSIIGSGFIIHDILCSHFNIEKKIWWKKQKDDENPESSSQGFRRSGLSSTSNARSSRRFAQRKTLNNSAYYRLMLAMSTTDFIVSFAWFCTTWPIPKDELVLDSPSAKVYGNIGTPNTCTAQAFFIQLGIITPFYNGLLSLYYYLTIRREWKEEDFKWKIEILGHFVSLAFGFGTSIAGLIMNIYNNSVVWCWIAPYPGGCGSEDNPCERGENAKVLRWAFYYGPLWVMIFFVAFFMSLVYIYVRGLDVKMNQYTQAYADSAARAQQNDESMEIDSSHRRPSLLRRSFSAIKIETLTEQRRQRKNERSKAVANQGLFYACTFALVWLFGTITRGMQLANLKVPWGIIFLFAAFTPSQGFFNFLVYVRPRIVKAYEKRKKKRRESRTSSGDESRFSSNVFHVSGISASSEVANDRNRDISVSSEIKLTDPFMNSPGESEEPSSKVVRIQLPEGTCMIEEDENKETDTKKTKTESDTAASE